ncbi:unnamed protein product [Phytomonas sp. EM1]|nr:unnamed protein product [Phytomonas sp. EM1]|eukprot:CCW65600.1 unnamed protein product [Phytomonas sp. isolate EM1]
MFSSSRVGRTLRLVSLTLVESPAAGTASLNLNLSRSNQALAYGFKLKADAASDGATTAPLRYRLVEIPPFLGDASRTVAALFPRSRIPEGGAVYLSAVNGFSAIDAKGMMRALVEGKDHAVQLTVEGMSTLRKARGRKSVEETAGDVETVVPAAELERKAEGKPAKRGRKKIMKAKTKLKERKSRKTAPAEVAEDAAEANKTTSDGIDDSIAKITAEMLGNRSSNTDASADEGGERSIPKAPKERKVRPSKRESTGRKGKDEENAPDEMSPTAAVDSHKASPKAEAIDGWAGNPLLDSTAAIIQLTQRLSTLVPPDEVEGVEDNSKGKASRKWKAVGQPPEQAKAELDELDSKADEGKTRDKKKSRDKQKASDIEKTRDKGKARDQEKKSVKKRVGSLKKTESRRATGDDGEKGLDATMSAVPVGGRGAKARTYTADAEELDSSGSFTLEL